MKKVCIFPEILESGIGRYANNLSEALLKEGAQVDLYVTSIQGDMFGQHPKDVRLFTGKGSTKTSILDFAQYLKKEKPDLLITAHAYVDIASVIARAIAKSPTVHIATIHTATSRDDQGGNTKLKKFYTMLCRWLYPHIHHIIAVSEAVANDTQSYFKLKKKVQVIYNPVIYPAMLQKSQMPAEHPFFSSKTHPVFISIGRLTEQKDFPTLLKAFALLRKQQAVRLIILGEGEERQSLEKLIENLGIEEDVSLPGFVDNPYAFIAASDAFVSSSAWEGLPTVMIEALAIGIPVIATDCPGGSKEILDDGQQSYGELVPVANPEALATAMKKILKHRPAKEILQQRGQMFSAEKAAKNYLRLLAT